MENYRQAAAAQQQWMVQVRRHLHRQPEVGLELPDTHAYLCARLTELGLDHETHPASGVTVRIAGSRPDGVTSVLRADMDALPVVEDSGVDFVSERPGAMHACGHDLHMAMLLGTARVLAERPPHRDTVLAFQPGEEADRGALQTLQHHNLDLAGPATAFAIHVNAVLPAHSINYRRDTFMAFGDWFRVDYRGEGGHASQPESTGNPIEAAAQFVQEVRALMTELGADEHVVATVTECQLGNTVNVIPATGHLRGTLRSLSPAQRDRLIAGVREAAARSAQTIGISAQMELTQGYPAVVNDADYVDRMVTWLSGSGVQPQEMPRPSMVIEDFSYFLHRWPGAMVYLGANVPGHTAFNHSAEVVFDEDVMTTGAALLLAASDGFQPA